GDEVRVKVIEVDEKGKISLDRLDKPEAPAGAERKGEKREGDHRRRRHVGDKGGSGEQRQPRRHHEG
ncbi:MAG: hypothetical protein U0K60_08710, partial [Parafannyhessea umbonata]|nr:hypothetical protein [Parafannyhessea umbonata]